MRKRRIRRKRRARVNILPLILVGVVIAGVITVITSVNLKGADIDVCYQCLALGVRKLMVYGSVNSVI